MALSPSAAGGTPWPHCYGPTEHCRSAFRSVERRIQAHRHVRNIHLPRSSVAPSLSSLWPRVRATLLELLYTMTTLLILGWRRLQRPSRVLQRATHATPSSYVWRLIPSTPTMLFVHSYSFVFQAIWYHCLLGHVLTWMDDTSKGVTGHCHR